MKSVIGRFTYSTTTVVAALFFCVTVMLGSPLISHAASATTGTKAKMSEADRLDARITDLHSKLGITAAQEEQWNKVVQVMRDNAATMESLEKARKEKQSTMNAVDNLKSYGEIMDEHATGMKNFIAVFEPLYAGMSDDQKQTADQVFTGLGKHHKKSKKK